MKKTSIPSFIRRHTTKLIGTLLMLIFSWPASAAVNGEVVEYNVSFVLGMIIPVIVVLVILKPIAHIRLRYPVILSLSLLVQLYALHYLKENQTTVLLMSAGAFVCAMLLTTIVEKLKGKIQLILTMLLGILFIIFSISTLWLPVSNTNLLWLAFIVINLMIGSAGVFLVSKKHPIDLKRESIAWVLVLLFSATIYFWLTTGAAQYWIIISAIAVYLMFVANYCWNVVKHSLLELKAESEQALEVQPQGNDSNSTFDPITNLPNYHYSLHCLRHYNNHDPSGLAIIVFKPINFAQVNKVLGHHNSDILLLQLAHTLQNSLADNELLVNFNQAQSPVRLARLQGLDFVVALDGDASHHPVKILVEQLCQQLQEAVPNAMSFKSFSLNFDLKFGVAFVKQHQNNLEQTIAFAGDALLESEKNHQLISYFNQETAIYTEQKLLVMEKLKQDIIDNKMPWLLQPQISLGESRLIGFELLTDWRSTHGNMLDNKEFIEIAEYSGEMYRLTRQIIEQACQLIASLHREHFYIQVSVNLSSKDVLEHDLIEFIEQVSERYHTALRYLVIELDESLLFKATDKTKLIIDQLKSIGVKVSINNFSGSYEALRYLRRLAIDQVKVDCSHLVSSIDSGQSEKIIISALINLIRKMKMPLIASGINNSEIKNTYIDIGGDIGQGNLITDGIKLEDAKKWTAQWLVDHIDGS